MTSIRLPQDFDFQLAGKEVLQIEREGLAQKVGWSPNLLLDEQRLRLPKSPAPKAVETVINHRVYRGRHITAAVSGGVRVDPWKITTEKLQTDSSGELARLISSIRPPSGPNDPWWWD